MLLPSMEGTKTWKKTSKSTTKDRIYQLFKHSPHMKDSMRLNIILSQWNILLGKHQRCKLSLYLLCEVI